jgi:cytochrome d ubiquinol oxidase subunit II
MTPIDLVAGAMLLSIVMYSLLAGADYGAGFWDLMCSGPRKDQQRHLIEQAIGPVWEANHVWLILTIVLLFSNFPGAFGAASVALAIPLLLVLAGIVFRGCSYVFRTYFTGDKEAQLYWGRIFSISSSLTPFFLGTLIGAISCDRVVMEGGLSKYGFIKTWISPFPLGVGILALSLFAYLSACYLAVEATTAELQDDFRVRALIASLVSMAIALAVYLMAGTAATAIRQGLVERPAGWLVEACAIAATIVALRALWLRHFQRARMAAAVQVAFIIVGWGIAQYPYLIRPDMTITNSAAPENVASAIDIALGCGAVVLIPSLALLSLIFKRTRSAAPQAVHETD